MSKLNADGTPRKKYVSKKMRMAKNRKIAQKKAWVTRRALYPETNGYKPRPPAGLEIIDEIVDEVVALESEPEPEGEYRAITKEEVDTEMRDIVESPSDWGIEVEGGVIVTREIAQSFQKKRDAADAVNRNLQARIKTIQITTPPNKLLSDEAHRLRDREIELEEIITALKHDLELAKKAIDKAEEQSQIMTDRCKVANFEREEAQELVKDLNQHNSLLTGELRGANYCFSKLAEEISKGKED